MLIKELNSVEYPFTHRSEVYAGKPTEDGPYYVKSVEDVTLRLVDKYSEFCEIQGRNITCDNLYTSLSLGKELLDRGVTVVGTLRQNRKGIPKEIKDTKEREENSTEIYWEKRRGKYVIVSYVVNTKSKGVKNILLLTTMPPLLGVTKDDGKQKPAIIKFYDFTKGGTDIMDQRMDTYTTSTKSRKWTKKAFCWMLDVARVNGQTILALNHGQSPRKTDSFQFAWDLAMALVEPHMQRRRGSSGLQKHLTMNMDSVLEFIQQQKPDEGDDRVEEVLPAAGDGTEGDAGAGAEVEGDGEGELSCWDMCHAGRESPNKNRCAQCCKELDSTNHKKEKDKLSKQKTVCQMCEAPTCKSHSIQICKGCAQMCVKKNVAPDPEPENIN